MPQRWARSATRADGADRRRQTWKPRRPRSGRSSEEVRQRTMRSHIPPRPWQTTGTQQQLASTSRRHCAGTPDPRHPPEVPALPNETFCIEMVKTVPVIGHVEPRIATDIEFPRDDLNGCGTSRRCATTIDLHESLGTIDRAADVQGCISEEVDFGARIAAVAVVQKRPGFLSAVGPLPRGGGRIGSGRQKASDQRRTRAGVSTGARPDHDCWGSSRPGPALSLSWG